MGLDGISINQIRILPENSAAEQSRNIKNSSQNEHKVVDGLAHGQRVDPDKDGKNKQNDNEFENDENENKEDKDTSPVIKYDLSQSAKYELKVDDETNSIIILEKATNSVVQKIEANELSDYVSCLCNSQGSIVNRKF